MLHIETALTSSFGLARLGTQFNIGGFLEETSPYAWALTGVALNIGLSVIGAGWCVPTFLRTMGGLRRRGGTMERSTSSARSWSLCDGIA